jgi:hypothetical protein
VPDLIAKGARRGGSAQQQYHRRETEEGDVPGL